MYVTSRSLRTIAWSAFVVYTARADHVMENLSFGYKAGESITPDHHSVPHFVVQGTDDYTPQILSDRIILTPPYPGNRRGSIWAQDALYHKGDWTAELDFRATGMERGGGNLQFWYVKDSQAHETPASLYTSPKFDGLVLLIDQYEGHGGSIRGFLNDGTKDIKSHPDPDTLAFGKCDYAYRNRGELTPIKMHHAQGFLEVIVDGQLCFKTDKVELPEGYYFGISASSAESPDSFEIHKFVVSTINSHITNPPSPNKKDYANYVNSQQQKQQKHQQHQQQQSRSTSENGFPQIIDDVSADTIRAQQEQFADLHNRVQMVDHHLATLLHRVYEVKQAVDTLTEENNERWKDISERVHAIDARSAGTMHNVEKVERATAQILRDLESKDFKEMMNQIHRALERNQDGVIQVLPHLMGAAITSKGPSMMTFLFIAVAVQITITGGYMLYKRRRDSAPKKYL
ncbi:hypothetical protein COCCADRAFT_23160 [Bipolaris zeicola 26-R-13]|uniref:L-type lectin-like domain-containing protein n=1 Tax=Cochliobolus carbonum (strain 26-R-13) TaxID=930089 RepID=W6YCM6_COCC2|nr:uncharacterized protein COCCADRAFT_23160 [Bipolaris zeicola 26-R-13]EUC37277.1 hypothetical protein COCCADRAFT_23160 [Bipolaris zeicola 26-R-13]